MFSLFKKNKVQEVSFTQKVNELRNGLNNLPEETPVTEKLVSKLNERGIELLIKTPQDIRILIEYMDKLPAKEKLVAMNKIKKMTA